MTADYPSSARCPSCGRFVGPYGRCPYCGADVGQRMAIRLFKYGGLVLAIGGLALLILAARGTATPRVALGSLVGTMNWAYVRTEGIVIRQPVDDPETGSIKFWISDGTGEILVIAYRQQASALREASLVPVMGDRIALEGTLRVKEDFQYLVLEVPEHTELHVPEPMEVAIAEIDESLLHRRVKVRGTVRAERQPYEGLRILTLCDATGQIDVTLAQDSGVPFEEAPQVDLGQSVEVVGAVDQYRGAPQISVGQGSDLVLLNGPVAMASLQPIGHLSRHDIGRMAAVEGTIIRVSPFSAGIKCQLDDGTGAVTLLLWQDLYESLADRDRLVPGTVVQAVGRLAEYRGDLEIVPEISSDLAVLSAGQIAIPWAHLGDLRPEDVGRYLQIEGVLRSVEAFSAGIRGVLDDGTGTLALLLWQDLAVKLDDRDLLGAGAKVSVRGLIAEYQGKLEIVPQEPADVSVISPPPVATTASPPLPSVTVAATRTDHPVDEPTAQSTPQAAAATVEPSPLPPLQDTATPSPEVRTIGTISVDDVGRTLTIDQAGIASLDYFSSGVKYTLSDGSGTITLLIWQNLMEEIPDRYDMIPGSQVGVTGRIEEYEGDLEIIPERGNGIRLLRRGERLPIEARRAADITPSDEGRIFAVAGSVSRAEGDGWLKLCLRYDSGEILVFVPQRTVPYLPIGLGPGARLRVTGKVDIYRGNLEIIPLAAADVEVP